MEGVCLYMCECVRVFLCSCVGIHMHTAVYSVSTCVEEREKVRERGIVGACVWEGGGGVCGAVYDLEVLRFHTSYAPVFCVCDCLP